MGAPSGLVFPQVEGRRSTTVTGCAIVADALAAVDPIGAAAAERETGWRQGYAVHFRRLVEAGLPDPQAARDIAAAGLASMRERMCWSSAVEGDDAGQDVPLSSWDGLQDRPLTPGPSLATRSLPGLGTPDRGFSLPYRGDRLTGAALADRLDRWVEDGVIEPGCATAVRRVAANPEWLSLPGRTVVVLGAGAEMGPLRALLRWGAEVAALDLPRPDLWRPLLRDVHRFAGTLHMPVPSTHATPPAGPGGPGSAIATDLAALAQVAGADLLHDLPEVTAWVRDLPGRLVIGNYVYADGATNVRVSAATDALTDAVLQTRHDAALAFLATPTDVFAVPPEAVAHSVERYDTHRVRRALALPLRAVSAGRLLRRGYVPGQGPGIADCIVPQQGPNYLLAKRIQRWRAIDARAAGHTVSFKVAPPTRTRSVVKNRALAAAYAGAHRFGVEVFEPATANTLMAALLVHDLMGPARPVDHPWQDEADSAAHGGLWRSAYDPRSSLGLAAMIGFASRQ